MSVLLKIKTDCGLWKNGALITQSYNAKKDYGIYSKFKKGKKSKKINKKKKYIYRYIDIKRKKIKEKLTKKRKKKYKEKKK